MTQALGANSTRHFFLGAAFFFSHTFSISKLGKSYRNQGSVEIVLWTKQKDNENDKVDSFTDDKLKGEGTLVSFAFQMDLIGKADT